MATNTGGKQVPIKAPLMGTFSTLELSGKTTPWCFAYVQDEGKVYATPRGMRSLQTGVNVLDTKQMSACYLKRLEKYSGYGAIISSAMLPSDALS